MWFVVILGLLSPSLVLAQSCAKEGDACCPCTGASTDPICMWPDNSYCTGGAFCDPKTLKCTFATDVVEPSSSDCGTLGGPCCEGVRASGEPIPSCQGTFACASGTCVDPAVPAVSGASGDECFGRWKECDEDKVCQETTDGSNGRCVPIRTVTDQSIDLCGHEGEVCCDWPKKQCASDNLSCASGDCVDITREVSDSSVKAPCEYCGACIGSPCCGSLHECTDGLVCGAGNKCVKYFAVPPPAKCGTYLLACCEGKTCGDSLECSASGLCLPPPETVPQRCSRRGDKCCAGKCTRQFLTCETSAWSALRDTCVQCGGLDQTCCKKQDGSAYCAGSNMACDNLSGKCKMKAGSCDAIGKGCCTNARDHVPYCNGVGLTCNNAVTNPTCTTCGGSGEHCCLPYDLSIANFQPTLTAMIPDMCVVDGEACNLDTTDPSNVGKCQTCGNKAAAPCCWSNGVPTCDAALGLICQAQIKLGQLANYYKCVKKPLEASAEPDPVLCGGRAQKCCDPDTAVADSATSILSTRCAEGLACNMQPNFNGDLLCETCGSEGSRCCYSADPDITEPICNPGLGCTNNISVWNDRRCVPCGAAGQPACWSGAIPGGYYCNVGTVGDSQICVV